MIKNYNNILKEINLVKNNYKHFYKLKMDLKKFKIVYHFYLSKKLKELHKDNFVSEVQTDHPLVKVWEQNQWPKDLIKLKMEIVKKYTK
jgi:DNA-binding HxlR family transcriptional regulator